MGKPTVITAAEHAAALCREFEGLRLEPYLCPAGIPTIGYGLTSYADGRRVTMHDDSITEDDAEQLLRDYLERHCIRPLVRMSPKLLDAPPECLAALASWAYNLGAGAYEKSTLRRMVDADDWTQVCVQLKRWVKAGNQTLPGLVRRREAEAALIEQAFKQTSVEIAA